MGLVTEDSPTKHISGLGSIKGASSQLMDVILRRNEAWISPEDNPANRRPQDSYEPHMFPFTSG